MWAFRSFLVTNGYFEKGKKATKEIKAVREKMQFNFRALQSQFVNI